MLTDIPGKIRNEMAVVSVLGLGRAGLPLAVVLARSGIKVIGVDIDKQRLIGEYLARTYHDQYGINSLIVRPFNAYGPGGLAGDYVGYGHVIPDLIKKTLSGKYPLEIPGSGQQTRSYTYVDDLVEAIVHVTERYQNTDFNIGNGVETSVLELAQRIWKLCGCKESFQVKHLPSYTYDIQRRVPDVSKILATGWLPRGNLDEGLSRTLKWVEQQAAIPH